MKTVSIRSSSGNYKVYIGNKLIQSLAKFTGTEGISRAFIIADPAIVKHHFNWLRPIIDRSFSNCVYFILPGGERSKSLDQAKKLYNILAENQFDKTSVIIAIGGGVTGDLAGYVASTYLRGIKLVHIPTTLLSMVDSSIGGKTAVNLNKIKNIVGTIYPPSAVICDSDFLKTLDTNELEAGFGEIIKYAFISDVSFRNYLKNVSSPLSSTSPEVVRNLIYKSVLIKKSVVEQDEKEGGMRKVLNFGHTFAHGIESSLNFRIRHGTAVGAGIICALIVSRKIGLLPESTFRSSLKLPLLMKFPAAIQKIESREVYERMLSDKKNSRGRINLVLIKDVGTIVLDVNPGRPVIISALNEMKRIISDDVFNPGV